jgi:hypothetical protein
MIFNKISFDFASICLAIQLSDLFNYYNKYSYDDYDLDIYVAAILLLVAKLYKNEDISMIYYTQMFYSATNKTLSNQEILNLQIKIIETLDGNLLIPTLASYVLHKGFTPKLQIVGYYLRKDLYSKNFKDVNIDNLIYLSDFKTFSLTIQKDDFILQNDFYISKDVAIPKKDFEKLGKMASISKDGYIDNIQKIKIVGVFK